MARAAMLNLWQAASTLRDRFALLRMRLATARCPEGDLCQENPSIAGGNSVGTRSIAKSLEARGFSTPWTWPPFIPILPSKATDENAETDTEQNFFHRKSGIGNWYYLQRNRPLSGVEGNVLAEFWLRLRSASVVPGTVTLQRSTWWQHSTSL